MGLKGIKILIYHLTRCTKIILIVNTPVKWAVGKRADNPISDNVVSQGIFKGVNNT